MITQLKSLSRIALIPASALMVSFAFSAEAAVEYKPGQYEVDPAHSRASFIVPHFVVSEVEGRFNDVKGEFTLAPNFSDSKAQATIDVKSIDTAVKKRDDHLRSKDFFEVAKYPTIKFVGKKLTGTPEAFNLVADLTIKDVTKEVTFDGKYTGAVTDSWSQQRAALQMTGKINRKDFHINYDDKISIGSAVGDEVTIRIWTEGVLKKDASKGAPAKK